MIVCLYLGHFSLIKINLTLCNEERSIKLFISHSVFIFLCSLFSNWSNTKYRDWAHSKTPRRELKIRCAAECCLELGSNTILSDTKEKTRNKFVKIYANRHFHVQLCSFALVRTGPGKPGKSWNITVAFFRSGKSWKRATGPWKWWKFV